MKKQLYLMCMPPQGAKTKKILELIVLETQGILICGGDMNVQLQPKLDTTNQRQKKSPNAIFIQRMFAELGLIDVWRESHPGEKQFTYYSPCHSVYTQIDYFFMYKSEWHRVRENKNSKKKIVK